MRLMSLLPSVVAARAFPLRMTYPRLMRVSMMAARDEGRPIPLSFMASRIVWSSIVHPAVSMARRRVASVYGFGGVVFFWCMTGVWGPSPPEFMSG